MEWKEVRLGDLYSVHNGLSKAGKYFGYGYPFLTFSDVFKNYFLPIEFGNKVDSTEKEQTNYNIKRGDVFITRTSETADELGMSSVALCDFPQATYNGFTKRLRPIDGEKIVLPEFIGYFLRSKSFRHNFFLLSGGMSTRASLANADLLNMSVKLPPIHAQRRIANILSSLDRKIELNNKINAQLEEIAQAIFKSWFVDFEPFKDGKFVDSELGLIPEGWRVGTLDEIASITKKSINPQKSPGTLYSHYSLPAFDEGRRPVTQFGKEIMSNKTLFESKTTLISKLNPHIKRIWFVNETKSNPICSTEFLPIKASNVAHCSFVHCLINSDWFYSRAVSGVNGATTSHQRIHPEDILNQTIAVNIGIIEKFGKSVLPTLERIEHNIEESLRLSHLRDTLLPKLMNGEIEI